MIKAILIDDEERATRLLKTMLQNYCKNVEVMATCSNVPDAVIQINKWQPDVVFCDIEMPGYSGFELLSFFNEVTFEIIFVTGYSEYAVKAFEVSAVDYLLKPVQIEKLELAVEKISKSKKNLVNKRLDTLKENLKSNEIQKIALPIFDGLQFVEVNDIILLEADGSYTTVFLKNKTKIIVSKRLKFFEILLFSKNQFFRVHRSSIININFINKYSKAESYIYLDNDKSVKIARDKKSAFELHVSEINLNSMSPTKKA